MNRIAGPSLNAGPIIGNMRRFGGFDKAAAVGGKTMFGFPHRALPCGTRNAQGITSAPADSTSFGIGSKIVDAAQAYAHNISVYALKYAMLVV
jgi:hypothetical protein